jgi:hypothetical protein
MMITIFFLLVSKMKWLSSILKLNFYFYDHENDIKKSKICSMSSNIIC